MTATRTTSLVARATIAAVLAFALLGAVQAVATSESASSATAPTFHSAALNMGGEF